MTADVNSWRRWTHWAEGFFGRRVFDPEAARECVQESCLRAWVHVQRRGSEMNPGLLGSICFRVFCEHLRRRYRRAARAEVGLDSLGEDPVRDARRNPWPGDVTDAQPALRSGFAAVDALRSAIAELPDNYRLALQARSEGLRMREIADRQGWTIGKVRMCLHRGRRMLEGSIRERIEDAIEDRFRS